ncbi:BCCT family transporter [Oceanimonas doudoroffii]|uniref:Transporter n=1 Tax=Oceanimonas doudoroffii TaxID=84158 RepID=A0A233RHT1_9GAMM|nr:BCCT family transporter [Oceanimonas doudoroffii]OXY82947.1 transporter [Oceanimonas doudoroffii]
MANHKSTNNHPGDCPSINQDLTVPRVMGADLPAVSRMLIQLTPPVVIIALIVMVLRNPEGVAGIIFELRTYVTGGFTWLFILYSVFAVAVCGWLAFSKVGKQVRLGGPAAKPEYSNFAWYSMLFACGQGVGLIFWSVAEPIMLRDDSPVVRAVEGDVAAGGIVWTYFHWGFTAWAMYCIVAVCLAYSHHNLGKTLTFREATVDMLPQWLQGSIGVLVELLAIMATVFGLATSFAFAAMQFTSGLGSFTSINGGATIWFLVIVALGSAAAISAFFGIGKGMKLISEANSVLSIVLVAAAFIFGPTLFILSNVTQTFGSYFSHFIPMSFWTDAPNSAEPLNSWQQSWNGWWTVFIWCWVIAFSPFVAGFIARISRGRTLREFVVGVTIVPSLIVMLWIGILGSAAIYYDDQTGRSISAAVGENVSSGLFAMLESIPVVGSLLLVVATVLVATYYVTSLDAGTYALAEFVSAPKSSGAWFRVALVISIAAVATVLLTLGGSGVVDTVQTGTIVGAFPFSIVILIMIVNMIKRLLNRDSYIKELEKAVNNPDPEVNLSVDENGILRAINNSELLKSE